MPGSPVRGPPGASRYERQSCQEQQRDGDEDEKAYVGIGEEAGKVQRGKSEKHGGHRRGDGHADK